MDSFLRVIKEKNRAAILDGKQHGFMFGPPSSSQRSLAAPDVHWDQDTSEVLHALRWKRPQTPIRLCPS